MKTFILIAIILATLAIIVLIWKCVAGRKLLKQVQRDSLIIYGKKGHGKTLLFSEMSRNCKDGYASTTDFKHKNQVLVNYDRINVKPNTWENVLEGRIIPIEKDETLEGKPIFLDDGGVYLPNFADSMLKRQYISMPIAVAVWRHLYNAPAHINSQDLERTWKIIREQADGFVLCRRTTHIFALGFISCTYYDRIESAKAQLAPMKRNLFNKYSQAEVEKYRAEHGIIKDFLIFAPTWRNKYDSRYFHKEFFGVEAPKKGKSVRQVSKVAIDKPRDKRGAEQNPC